MASSDAKMRPLDGDEKALIERARRKAHILYEGREVAHRSCGIALAETFGLRSAPYQSLRKGGITGEGECGSIKAGELILGEVLGDPDPTGIVTVELRAAASMYRDLWRERLRDRAPGSIICNDLTSPLGDFSGDERKSFCTALASDIAAVICEVLLRCGVDVKIGAIPEA